PDFEAVVDSGDDDVAIELCVRDERRRNEHTALAVGRRVGGAGKEIAAELPFLPAQLGERRKGRLLVLRPALGRPRDEASVEPPRDDAAVLERPAELRRKGQTLLVVKRVLVLAEEHGATLPLVPRCPTLTHHGPLCPAVIALQLRFHQLAL